MMSGLSGRRNYNGNDDDSDQSCWSTVWSQYYCTTVYE
jgi:hypothetical protein